MAKVKVVVVLLVLLAFSFAVVPALADSIRINPNGSYWGAPVMLSSPATFYANVTSGGEGTHSVGLFMAITESCFESLTDDVTVTWDAGSNAFGPWVAGTVDPVVWTGPVSTNGLKLPPTAVNGYTVASVKDHLDTDEPIYWAFVEILDGAKLDDDDGIPFTVTLPAGDPHMGLWLIGKNPGSDVFDNQTPTTQPGFVVPEAATALATVASLAAMGSYVFMKKRGIRKL